MASFEVVLGTDLLLAPLAALLVCVDLALDLLVTPVWLFLYPCSFLLGLGSPVWYLCCLLGLLVALVGIPWLPMATLSGCALTVVYS